MREDTGQLAGYRAVYELHDVEICREEDVEVALVDLPFVSPDSYFSKIMIEEIGSR
jgi:hypothetical protein